MRVPIGISTNQFSSKIILSITNKSYPTNRAVRAVVNVAFISLVLLTASPCIGGQGSELQKLQSRTKQLMEKVIEYRNNHEYRKAIKLLEEVLILTQKLKDEPSELVALSNIGYIYTELGDNQNALNHYKKMLEISRITSRKKEEATTLNNIGFIYNTLGKNQAALQYYKKSLLLSKALGRRQEEATTLNNIGLSYAILNKHQRALVYYKKSLPIARTVGDSRGEATTLNNIGRVYAALGEQQTALEYYKKSLPIARAVGDHQGKATTLNNIGLSYAILGEHNNALKFYIKSLPLSQALGRRRLEAATLFNIGNLLENKKQHILGTIFYKKSINIVESLRADIETLPQDLQDSFTGSISSRYRRLANLLLQQDRVLEAQQVLDLLKLQEVDEYLGDVRGKHTNMQSITIQQPEKEILNKFNEFQSAIELGIELEKLRNIPQEDRSASEIQRIIELITLEETINKDFNQFTESKSIKKALNQLNRKTRHRTVALKNLDAMRHNLGRLNAVLLYPLILEDRLELVITTANSAPLRRVVPVSREQLNKAIVEFRLALADRSSSDIEILANKLYQWIIEPIEVDLQQANAEVIIYAPDRQLRYIPLSALHDGKRWLIQRFQINNITANSLSNLEPQRDSKLNVLAGAFVQGEYQFNIGSKSYNYAGLRYAGEEVSQLATAIPNTTQYRDQKFSKATFQSLMNEYQIVHFATHATFLPGQPEDSFILFGNGDRATLREIANWSLFNVDLVVLSACETAIGGKLGTGNEILGLGYQFQSRGAKATIASLWSVDDRGTSQLMSALYEKLKDSNSTKAEALQQAKVALISGNNTTSETSKENQYRNDSDAQSTPYKHFQHPYYWAPFILIGNGF